MANTTASLKNVNLLSKAQYDAIANPATDELWAVDVESDSKFKSTIVGWGMPSDRYVDLTLGASGSTYTAPANGYLYFVCQGPTSYFYMLNQTIKDKGGELGMCVNLAGGYYRAFLPVQKGHQINVYYDGPITFSAGFFFYVEGEE